MKKIVITGGPSTGKTSIINEIEVNGYFCMQEISRQITLDARSQGIEHLFLTDPILFSEKLLVGRVNQFNEAKKSNNEIVFFDRGIPDILAYLKGSETSYKDHFNNAVMANIYDTVFILPPWKEIHKVDNERYEDFEEAKRIHKLLQRTYTQFGYQPILVPTGTVAERIRFIFYTLNLP